MDNQVTHLTIELCWLTNLIFALFVEIYLVYRTANGKNLDLHFVFFETSKLSCYVVKSFLRNLRFIDLLCNSIS